LPTTWTVIRDGDAKNRRSLAAPKTLELANAMEFSSYASSTSGKADVERRRFALAMHLGEPA